MSQKSREPKAVQMFDGPVVFVDIETTGGSYRTSRVLEVAAIRVEDGEVTDEFSTLVNPGTYIPRQITALTGITDEDVIGAPSFDTIADRFMEIMDGATFVAHNVRFDYSFLKAELAAVGLIFQPKLLCTVRLSRALYADKKGHSLAKLIERHEIPFDHRHRALDDARAIQIFSHIAFTEKGPDAFAGAIARQLKTQSLPPNLDHAELADVGNGPGVYIFEDEYHQPIYVGKSVTLKKRIMSHFTDTTSKELKISQNVHHIRTIPTANELSALILESKMVKQLQPIFNRQLRRVTNYAMFVKNEPGTDNPYATIKVVSGRPTEQAPLELVYGLYETRTKAHNRLEDMTRTFDLCPKLMGLEKAKKGCFSYSLGKCKGACVGKEDPVRYNERFETALMHSKLERWPYGSAVAVPIGDEGSGVLIDQWIVKGFYSSDTDNELEPVDANFDVDEYKIVRRFLRENKASIVPAPTIA